MANNPNFQYPVVYRDESVVDTFFKRSVSDPYRWLEDPSSEKTKRFKKDQTKLTNSYLEQCPLRHKIREKINELSDFSQRSCPIRRGDNFFFTRSFGLQNQSVLYSQKSLTGDAVMILDPNGYSTDGTVSLNIYNVSPNAKYLAFGLSKNGSDWMKIRFKNLDTNKLCEDVLTKVKFTFGITWTEDSKGIFYGSFPHHNGSVDGTDVKETVHQKLYYHRVGTSQSLDVLVYEFLKRPNWIMGAIVADSGDYLLMTIRQGVKDNLISYAKYLSEGLREDLDLRFKPLVEKFEADYTYITNEGPLFYFCTNKEASNGRVRSVNVNTEYWRTVVSEHTRDVIDWVKCVDGNKLLICYLRNVKHVLQIRDLRDGYILRDILIELGGSITRSLVLKSSSDFFITVETFVCPGQVYRVNLSDDKPKLKIMNPNYPEVTDPNFFTTKQVFYTSKDGTKIPMFIVHKKNLKPNKYTPCYLHGYGGYGFPLRTKFTPFNIVFMQNFNGVIAAACIRGGGEYGRNWHNGGRLLNKQNGFDDFQAAAKYLIINQLTSAKKLTIHGMSNGGFLIGACINQRPDLFGAAIAEVGILDLLRFHKFTVGRFWCNEFGHPESPEYFEYLLRISPLHNIKQRNDTQYPAVLLLASENDDRVVPSHSFKFIAELQHQLGHQVHQKNPMMVRIEKKAGHELGRPLDKLMDEQTDILAFIARALGLLFVEYKI